MRTYIKSSEFQSRSELLIIENRLPLTDEVTVDLVLKCLQHLHLLALHLEILGYIPHLLNGLVGVFTVVPSLLMFVLLVVLVLLPIMYVSFLATFGI